MNGFMQSLQTRLQGPEFRAGYEESQRQRTQCSCQLPDREELAKVIRDAIRGNPLTATFQMDLDAADAVFTHNFSCLIRACHILKLIQCNNQLRNDY